MFNFTYLYKFELLAYKISRIYYDVKTGELGIYMDHPSSRMPAIIIKVFGDKVCIAKIVGPHDNREFHLIKESREYLQDNGLDLYEEILSCISVWNAMKKTATPLAVNMNGLII